MTIEQIAYTISVVIAWVWALSQIRIALTEIGHWPPRWRVTAAQWMTAKAIFFTYLGFAVWTEIPDNDGIVYLFAASELWAFVHWLTLPSPEKVDSIYLKESQS